MCLRNFCFHHLFAFLEITCPCPCLRMHKYPWLSRNGVITGHQTLLTTCLGTKPTGSSVSHVHIDVVGTAGLHYFRRSCTLTIITDSKSVNTPCSLGTEGFPARILPDSVFQCSVSPSFHLPTKCLDSVLRFSA